MLAADPAVASLLPRFAFLLDDVSHLADAELRARALTAPARVALFLLARAGSPGLTGRLGSWVDDLRDVLARPDGREVFRALITYLYLVAEGSRDALRPILEEVGPDAEEAYVTIAEQLRAEGEAEGEARGEARGRAEALLQLMESRFGPVPDAAADIVRSATGEQVRTWTARVLTASTVDDVLG